MITTVFDKSKKRLAYLDNAFAVSYNCQMNTLWTASFSMPTDDPKNVYCAQNNLVQIYDGIENIGLFRIIGEDKTRSTDAITTYKCEHVLALLLDDVLFRFHRVGGAQQKTSYVLNYILDAQTIPNWQLDRCDFDRRFEYSFENENLLSALFSVPQCFGEEYMWTWDTSTTPWRIRLVTVPEDFTAEIRYAKNMIQMQKSVDSTNIANRIYALGYGEGVNQLNLTSVNNGLPYVEDVISQSEYGLKSTIIVDSRYKSVESLQGYALQKLQELSVPYYTYEISAVDLYRLTGDDSSHFRVGDIIRVIDEEDNIALRTRVMTIQKSNVDGDPGGIKLVLANKDKNLSGSIANLQNRARISETYSQGATNLMIQNFADNADPDHPAELDVYIPDEAVRINKVVLNIQFQPFRGYTHAIESVPGYITSSEDAGGVAQTTDTSLQHVQTAEAAIIDTMNALPGTVEGTQVHNHGIRSTFDGKTAWIPIYVFDSNGQAVLAGYDSFVASGAHTHGSHSHKFYIPPHTHPVSVPPHSHPIEIPPHTHDFEFGIYDGETANDATIIVDNNVMPDTGTYSNLDLTAYLGLDNSGKIQRGTFHKVKVVPDRMTRIVGALFVQLFTSPQSGGDY